VRGVAKDLEIKINERLVGQLEGESSSPELGYQVTRKLIATNEDFTALFAFNDVSAIGRHSRIARNWAAARARRYFRGGVR